MHYRKILGFALGPVAGGVLGLLTVPLMAWFFSPEDIGRMNIFQVVMSFALLFSVLGLDQAYVREYHESLNKSRLIKACFYPGLILLAVCVLVLLPFRNELSLWLFSIEDSRIFILAAVCIVLNYISRFLSLILRMQERGLAYSMSQIIPKLMQIVFLGLFIWQGFSTSFILLLTILCASMMTVVLVYGWNTRRELIQSTKAKIDILELQKIIKFGFPLIFSGLAFWALNATSTLVLRSHSTLEEVGVYAVTSSVAGVATIFQSIFTVVWAPIIYKWVQQGVDMVKLDKISQQALAFIIIVIGIVTSLAWILDYILPSHYINVKYLIACSVLPAMLYTLSEITCVGIAITRRTIFTIYIALSSLLVNIMLSLWLIPEHGAAGAVISNALAYMVFFIGRTEVSSNIWRQLPRLKIYSWLLGGLALAIMIAYYRADLLINRVVFVTILCAVIVAGFASEIKGLINRR